MYNNDATGNSSDFLTGNNLSFQPDHQTILQAGGDRVELPDASFVRDAEMSREGMDLVLKAPDGSTVVIEGYFAAIPAPLLQAPDGSALTPELVQSFVAQPLQYADANGDHTATDETPVGTVQEVAGKASVTHMDGTVETIQIGTQIFQGDIIETDDKGAVNIQFVDETTFAVSEDARLAIDEYVYDPSTQSGSTNFSVLKGVFVFTSGMIGREDPDDVHIDTPVGSIGIRGTIIAGNVTSGEITVVEGAIVLKDFSGHEMTLASQFETARFNPSTNRIEHMGQMSATQVVHNFSAIASVSPQLFSSINDSAKEAPANNGNDTQQNNQNGEGDNAQPGQNGQGGEQPQDVKPDQHGSADQAAPAPAQTAATGPAGSGLTGNSSGLTGDSSGLSSGTSAGSSANAQTTTGTTAMTGGTAAAPAGGATTIPAPQKTAASTQQQTSSTDQAPPEVIQNQAGHNTGSGAGTGITTPPPANVPPTITGISGTRSIAENTATVTEVARVQADSGNAGETLTYKLLSGQSFFSIDQNGAITTKAGIAFDYETNPHTIDVQVEVSDGKDVTTQTIQINVSDVNEAPTALTIDNTSIDENSAANTVIGTFTTADPDSGETFTYSIVGDPDDKFAIVGNQLVVNGALDFETTASHTVTVRTTDAGGLTHDQTFTINVADVSESTNTAPMGTDNPSLGTDEDTALTLNVSDFGFSDPDAGDTMQAVKIDSLPSGGILMLNGTAVTVGETIGVADITAGYLVFYPEPNYNGTVSFTFFVQDNQGAYSATANTMTVTIAPDTIWEGTAVGDTFTAVNVTDSFDTVDGSIGYDIYDATAVTASPITLDLYNSTVTIGSDTNTFSSFEEFRLGTAAGNTVHAASSLANDIVINASAGSYDTFDGTGITSAVIFDAATNSLNDGSGHYYQLNGFEQIDVNGGTLNFLNAYNPVDVDLMLQKVTNDGSGNSFAFSGFDHVNGSDYNDSIGLNYSSDQSVDSGYGNDIFTMGIDISSRINTTLSNDGNVLSLIGGWGIDTISFTDSTGNNYYKIDADGTEDTIDSIEIFDFAANTAHDIIDFAVNDEMFDNLDATSTITIRINDLDELNLDFTAYDDGGSFILFTQGTTFQEYRNIITNDVIRVENTLGNGDDIHTKGLIDLELDALISSPSSFTQQGNAITASGNMGFGNTFAAIGDQDNNGHDDLLVGWRNHDRISIFNDPSSQTNADSGGVTNLPPSLFGGAPIDSTSYIGDFNGDGKADFVLGSSGFNGSGKAMIVDEYGTVLYQLTGTTGQKLGDTVTGVGDVNGDGFDDVLISAPGNGGAVGAATLVYGGYYTPTATPDWNTAAFSSDKQHQAVAGQDGRIYVSQDGGTTWTLAGTGHTGGWTDISISDNGMKLAATVSNGYIYTSNDGGAHWTAQNSSIQNWSSITISDDGTKLAATVSNGYIYTSSDSGATWTQRTSPGYKTWSDITSSSDGTKLAATVSGGYIYTSSDSGVTWTQQANSGSRTWTSIAFSDDDTKLIAADSTGGIYTSSDGITWAAVTSLVSGLLAGLSISDDGTTLTAIIGEETYVSTNGGTSWALQSTHSNPLQVVHNFDTESFGLTEGYGDSGYGSVAAAGDFDGDGKQDLIFTNGTYRTVSIAFGGDLGSSTNYITFNNIVTDPLEKDIPVFSLGDINGDGLDDLAIAETGANSGNGAVHIVYGSTTANGAADIHAASDITIDTSGTPYAIIGGGAVGDFNGDGIDDMALAFKIPGLNERDVDIFVLYGGSDAMMSGTITMDDLLNNDNAFHMTYTIPGTVSDADNFDIEIGRAGDVNGDGLYDLAIGLPETGSGNDDGTVAIVYGQTSDGMDVMAATSLTSSIMDNLYANGSNQTLMGGAGDDMLDQNTAIYSDLVMLGGSGNDTFRLYEQNFNQIDGGSGNDIIKFQASNVDLSSFTGNDIARVETLGMEAGAQTLKINLSTIMDLMNSSDTGNLAITSTNMGSNLVIDTNHTGDSQITSGSANTAGQVKLALEDVFGDGNVQYNHDVTGGAGGQGVDHFTIGGHTLSIDSALIDTIVVGDVPPV